MLPGIGTLLESFISKNVRPTVIQSSMLALVNRQALRELISNFGMELLEILNLICKQSISSRGRQFVIFFALSETSLSVVIHCCCSSAADASAKYVTCFGDTFLFCYI